MDQGFSFIVGFALFGFSAAVSIYVARFLLAGASGRVGSVKKGSFFALFLPLKFVAIVLALYFALVEWDMNPLGLVVGTFTSVCLVVLVGCVAQKRLKKI
ncbi:MAG: hypothetical protein AB7T49_02625 [Oligoflexales bacterium]